MVNYYNNYNRRIQFLRAHGDQLLQRIQMLEINLKRRKQQPHDSEVITLHSMVKKLLQMLAEINTCQYFQLTKQIFNSNNYYYKQMCFRYFQDLMLKLTLKLRRRRRRRRRRRNDIDFTISSVSS